MNKLDRKKRKSTKSQRTHKYADSHVNSCFIPDFAFPLDR
jgi:hypothetical protein